MTEPNLNDLVDELASASMDDPRVAQEMLPLVYDELRSFAHKKLARESPGLTLQATALVHEAYLRLLSSGRVRWENRRHFFAAAAEAMRRILIERARKYKCVKRGGGRRRIELDDISLPAPEDSPEAFVALDQALQTLQDQDPQLAELVKLRYFAGLTIRQTAELLAMAPATVKRHWSFAQVWLQQQMACDDADGPGDDRGG